MLRLYLGLGRYIVCIDNGFRVRHPILEGLTKSHGLMRLSMSRSSSQVVQHNRFTFYSICRSSLNLGLKGSRHFLFLGMFFFLYKMSNYNLTTFTKWKTTA